MGTIDCAAIRSKQCNHLTVSTPCRVAIVGPANEKQRARRVLCNPTCPGRIFFAELQCQSQLGHDGRIETEGTLEVGDADKNM